MNGGGSGELGLRTPGPVCCSRPRNNGGMSRVLVSLVFSIDFSGLLLFLPRALTLSKLFIIYPHLFIDSFHLQVSIELVLCAFCKHMITSRARVWGGAETLRGESSCLTKKHFVNWMMSLGFI